MPAHAAAAARVMAALAITAGAPRPLALRTSMLDRGTGVKARTGAAAAAVIDLLRAPENEPNAGSTNANASGLLSMQSRVDLAALARATVAAAWASAVGVTGGGAATGDDALESSPLSAAAIEALGMVLAHDADAVAAAALLLADPRREAMPAAAYPVAVTAFVCLPDAAHVVLARRVGLHVIAAVVGKAVQVDPTHPMVKAPGTKR